MGVIGTALAVIGGIAIAFGLFTFIVNLWELFDRVDRLENTVNRMEDFHGTTD